MIESTGLLGNFKDLLLHTAPCNEYIRKIAKILALQTLVFPM